MTHSTLPVAPDATTASGPAARAEPATLFYLGTHQPHWLNLGVPLFISDRRLRRYHRLPRAAAWGLDSGGFTELSQYGTWDTGPTPREYVARVRRYRDEIGRLAWAAPQDWMFSRTCLGPAGPTCSGPTGSRPRPHRGEEPAGSGWGRMVLPDGGVGPGEVGLLGPELVAENNWMCEPFILAKTGLTVAEHQARTVDNYLRLRDLAPDLPLIPVVQGWAAADYLRCVERYARAGVDLSTQRLVGVGSVCRRQSTTQVGDILTALHQAGVSRLHGFGFKTLGLARWGHLLTSADSMAWSAQARRQPPLPGCHTHINCANCSRYALAWRTRVLATVATSAIQPALFPLSPAGWTT